MIWGRWDRRRETSQEVVAKSEETVYFTTIKKKKGGVPVTVRQKGIWLGTMRLCVQSLALLSGLKIQCCHDLWGSLQMWLGSGVAVALGSLAAEAPIRHLAWEPPYAAGVTLKRTKKDKKKQQQQQQKKKVMRQGLSDVVLNTTYFKWVSFYSSLSLKAVTPWFNCIAQLQKRLLKSVT